MNNKEDLVELSLYGSNKFSSQKVLTTKSVQHFAASLSRSEQVKLKNYLHSPVNATKRHHELSLSNHTVTFNTDSRPASRQVVIRDIKVINDVAIKRAKLRDMSRDSGAGNYVLEEEMLKGVDGGKIDLAKRKELGKRMDDKFQFAEGQGSVITKQTLDRYWGYLWMILSTQSGRKLANIRDTRRLLVVLFSHTTTGSSYGNDRVYLNTHPSQSQRYAEAFGHNTYVQLGGIRTLVHELTHAYYRDTGSRSMKEREEIQAMQLANRIMREIYGLDAGERKNYKSVDKDSDEIKDGAVFLK